MCGRFAKFTQYRQLREELRVVGEPSPPRWNVAPDSVSDLIRAEGGGNRIAQARWGLVPSWADDETFAFHTFNARAETLAGKPAFREPFRRRRCLVPMDGFYEWEKSVHGKQPWFIRMQEGAMAVAGLWARREGEGEPLESFTIVTCPANALLRPIHDRMPVILPPERWSRWLDPDCRDVALLSTMLVPADAALMERYTVSPRVNGIDADDAALVEPWTPAEPRQSWLL